MEKLAYPEQRLPVSAAAAFETTSWSLIERAARGDATDALSSLCSRYWQPVYAFLRRRGHAHASAEDLTQSFFAQMIEKRYLQQAESSRGRFRSFLLAAVTHFAANEADREATKKRGGGVIHVDADPDLIDLRDNSLSPEEVFEKRWALAVIDGALAALRSEMERRGKKAEFDRLAPFLTGATDESMRELAESIRTSEGAARVAVHRLRQQFRVHLRNAVADSVTDETDVDDEIRFLIEAVGR